MLLAGCSAVRLGYNQAPHLAYWWLNGYVDFDAEQGERARDALADWFAWHRATQLPDYAGLLAVAQQQILHDVTPAQVCGWADALRNRIETGYDHAVPAIATLVGTLKPQQLQRMERRYREADKEFREEYLQADRAERLKESNKRAASRAEMIYGELSESQRALLEQGIAQSPFDPQRWLLERQLRQREIVDTLRALQAERADTARTESALRLFAAHAAQSPRAPYRDYQQRLFDHNCRLIARLHNSTTPEQRRHGADRLKGWEVDLRALNGAAQP
ncbi:MAG TPA: DUF6279 family lipoprotein [Burkholderiaceae bacterium]|nr:DUF6279 family lipoprotein [Burkholderiaceae bacterium]